MSRSRQTNSPLEQWWYSGIEMRRLSMEGRYFDASKYPLSFGSMVKHEGLDWKKVDVRVHKLMLYPELMKDQRNK